MKHKRKIVFFCLAGASGAIVELLIFNILSSHFIFAISKAIALVGALTLNFFINRNITFLAKKGRIKKQIARYYLLYTTAIIFNFLVSLGMSQILGQGFIMGNIAAVSGILAALPLTFFGSMKWVFKKSTTPKISQMQ